MKKIFLFFMLFTNTVSFGNEPLANGCGPAFGELYLLAPNKIKSLGIDFTSACNLHDLCYANSAISYLKDKNGLYRNQFKTNSEQRTYCDDVFKDSMKEQCSTLPSVEKGICHSLAFSYFSIVMVSGWLPFTKDTNIKESLDFNPPYRLKRIKSDIEEWLSRETTVKKDSLSNWFPKETSAREDSLSNWFPKETSAREDSLSNWFPKADVSNEKQHSEWDAAFKFLGKDQGAD